jgi:hypothetical protein
MSVADDINGLAALHAAAAHQALNAIIALGPRPADPAAGQAWDRNKADLQAGMNSQSATATELASQAVLAALADQAAAIGQLTGVTARAEAEIKHIQEVSKLLARLAQVLDVGRAVLGVAAAPSAASLKALADAIKALSAAVP